MPDALSSWLPPCPCSLACLLPNLPQLYPLPNPSIEAEEEALLQRRQALHRLLALPPDRPLLRVANAVAGWSGGSGSSPGATNAAAAVGGGSAGGLDAALAAGGVGGKQRLRDVHVGLPPPSLGGSVHLVQGSYDYYHYMQVCMSGC